MELIANAPMNWSQKYHGLYPKIPWNLVHLNSCIQKVPCNSFISKLPWNTKIYPKNSMELIANAPMNWSQNSMEFIPKFHGI